MNRLKELRKEKKLTLRSLENETGINYVVLGYLEREVRPFTQEHLDKLCSYFGVSTDYMLGKSDIRNTSSISDLMKQLAFSDEQIETAKNSPQLSEVMKRFSSVFAELTDEQRQSVVQYAEFLSKQKKESD